MAGATGMLGARIATHLLHAATDGVDVVVSAVQGGYDVIVDGQVALAEAAAGNGVRRILPSDYALDLFKATPGEHFNFDLRRQADEAIAGTGLEHVHVLNGAFMDGFVGSYGGRLDHAGRTATYWGNGERPSTLPPSRTPPATPPAPSWTGP